MVDWSGGANRAVKAIIVMRPQIEMIGVLLGVGGKAIPITVWQRTWINRGHSLVLVESRSRERRANIFDGNKTKPNKDTKQGVWSAAGFLLVSRVEHKRMDPEWKLS